MKSLGALVLILGEAACSTSSNSDPLPSPNIAPAAPGFDLSQSDINHELSALFLGRISGAASLASKQHQLFFRATADPNTIDVYSKRKWNTLTYVPAEFGFIGGIPNGMMEVYSQWKSPDNQLEQVYVATYPSDDSELFAGYGYFGILTSAADVAALSATSTYTGRGGLAIWDDNGKFSDGKGPFTLNIDFTSGTAQGQASFRESGFSDAGSAMPANTVTIAASQIVGNTFAPQITFDATALGLDNSPSITTRGALFGENASSVGIGFEGNATKNGGGNRVMLQGSLTGSR